MKLIKYVAIPLTVFSTILGLLTLFAIAEVNHLKWFHDRYLSEGPVNALTVTALIVATIASMWLFIACVKLVREEQD